MAPMGFGCNQCESGYVGTTFNETLNMCIRSDALVNSVDQAKNVWIIQNCKYYYLNVSNEIVCLQCQSGNILQEDKKKCYNLVAIPYCKTASNGGATCLLCDESYYYNSIQNQCTPGNIPNCSFYSNETQCHICKTGYFAAKITNARIICFEDSLINCADLTASSAVNGVISCNRCKVPYFLRTDAEIASFPIKMCLGIPLIDNCSEYSKSPLVTQSTLNCKKCIDSHYVDLANNNCIKRIYLPAACEEYGIDFDGCKTCSKGLYLGPSKKECIIYPTAIVGCLQFKDAVTCTRCGVGRYLKSNECIEIFEEYKIVNCRFYKNSKECDECDQSYYLNDNKCTQAYASNCVAYVNAKECSVCKRGYGLSTLSGITSCVFVQISNCKEPDENSIGPSFKCKTCVSDFYPDSAGVCRIVPIKLINCSLYSTKDNCMKCSDGFVLYKNACAETTELLEYVDQNCDINLLERKCITCDDEYYFTLKEGAYICARKSIYPLIDP